MSAARLRPLLALRRLRQLELDEARRVLAEALAHEAALTRRDADLARDVADARAVTGAYDPEAFNAFLARIRAERELIAEAACAAAARVESARGGLASRRVAEAAADDALARAHEILTAEMMRRDQLMLEDVARALRRRAD